MQHGMQLPWHCPLPFSQSRVAPPPIETFYQRVCHRGHRPKIPSHVPPQLSQMLNRCWDVDPANRPEISEIIPLLDALIKQMGDGA